MKKFLFLLFAFLHFLLPLSAHDQFYVVGFRMCGADLTEALINKLTDTQGKYLGGSVSFDSFLDLFQNKKFYPTLHINQAYKLRNELNTLSPSVKKVIYVRDPRDVVVKYLNNLNIQKAKDSRWKGLTTKQKLKFILSINEPVNSKMFDTNTHWLIGFYDGLKNFLHNNPDTLVLYFEDLVKSEDSLLAEMQKLSNFLELPFNQKKALSIIGSLRQHPLVGNFNQRKVGLWKDVFDQEIEQLFNEKYKDILLDWGYIENQRKPSVKQDKKEEKPSVKQDDKEEGPSIWSKISELLKKRREF